LTSAFSELFGFAAKAYPLSFAKPQWSAVVRSPRLRSMQTRRGRDRSRRTTGHFRMWQYGFFTQIVVLHVDLETTFFLQRSKLDLTDELPARVAQGASEP